MRGTVVRGVLLDPRSAGPLIGIFPEEPVPQGLAVGWNPPPPCISGEALPQEPGEDAVGRSGAEGGLGPCVRQEVAEEAGRPLSQLQAPLAQPVPMRLSQMPAWCPGLRPLLDGVGLCEHRVT